MENQFDSKNTNSLQEKIKSLQIKFIELVELITNNMSNIDSKFSEYNILHCELEDLLKKLDKFSKHCPDTKDEWNEFDSLNEPVIKKWEEIFILQDELNNLENSQKDHLEELEKTKREIFINQHIN